VLIGAYIILIGAYIMLIGAYIMLIGAYISIYIFSIVQNTSVRNNLKLLYVLNSKIHFGETFT